MSVYTERKQKKSKNHRKRSKCKRQTSKNTFAIAQCEWAPKAFTTETVHPTRKSCGKPHEVYRPQRNLSEGGGRELWVPRPGQWGGTPVLSWTGQGVPQDWGSVPPGQDTCTPCPGLRYPSPRTGVPLPSQVWGTPPEPGLGYPLGRIWDQRPVKEPGTGVPSPQVWTDKRALPTTRVWTHKVKILPFASFGMRAIKIPPLV